MVFAGARVGNNIMVSCQSGGGGCNTVGMFAPCRRLGDVVGGTTPTGRTRDLVRAVCVRGGFSLRGLCGSRPRCETIVKDRNGSGHFEGGVFRGISIFARRHRGGNSVQMLNMYGGGHI